MLTKLKPIKMTFNLDPPIGVTDKAGYYLSILSGIQEAVKEYNIDIEFISCGILPKIEHQNFDDYVKQHVDKHVDSVKVDDVYLDDIFGDGKDVDYVLSGLGK